jgi:hypothetical protein
MSTIHYNNSSSSTNNNSNNNNENFGLIKKSRTKRISRKKHHTRVMNSNHVKNSIPMLNQTHHNHKKATQIHPINSNSRYNNNIGQIKKQNWIHDDNKKKMLSKARMELEIAFNTLANLTKHYHRNKLSTKSTKSTKTKKNINPMEIRIGKNMDKLTSIIQNLESIIPPAPREPPPPRPPQENNNSLSNNNNNQ